MENTKNPLPAIHITRDSIGEFVFVFPQARGLNYSYTRGDVTSYLNQITPDHIFTLNTHEPSDFFYFQGHHYITLQFPDEFCQVSFIQNISSLTAKSRESGLHITAGPHNSIILRDEGDGQLFWRLQDLIRNISIQPERVL